MATKTSAIIDSVDSNGKKYSRAITDIDPNASDERILDFVESVMELSGNTFGGATRIDKTDLMAARQANASNKE